MSKVWRNGVVVDMTPAELAEQAAQIAEWDAGALDRHKAERIAAVRTEADTRIAALFGKEPRSYDLLVAQLNATKRTAQLLDKKTGAGLGAGEQAEVAAMRATGDALDAIRAASNDAQAAVQAAADVAAVDAVVVAWPA